MFIFKKRVGYFLFFHLRNCQMETECSHITHNSFIPETLPPENILIIK